MQSAAAFEEINRSLPRVFTDPALEGTVPKKDIFRLASAVILGHHSLSQVKAILQKALQTGLHTSRPALENLVSQIEQDCHKIQRLDYRLTPLLLSSFLHPSTTP